MRQQKCCNKKITLFQIIGVESQGINVKTKKKSRNEKWKNEKILNV